VTWGKFQKLAFTSCKIKILFYLLTHINKSYGLEKTLIGSHVTNIGPFYDSSLMLVLFKILAIMYYL
jgi:hypothetical protein